MKRSTIVVDGSSSDGFESSGEENDRNFLGVRQLLQRQQQQNVLLAQHQTTQINSLLTVIQKQTTAIEQLENTISLMSTGSDNRMKCGICIENEIRVAFIPCGHIFCDDCAPKLLSCPNCSAEVAQKVKLYF